MDGLIAVGDSKDRGVGAFAFPPDAWGIFIEGVKNDLVQGLARGQDTSSRSNRTAF
ncbi:DUF397 domain-containing protein [Streptomyces sp. NPDC059477]|uniref:DUF397 domain-containing protein n=1 Tax=Streptomyces sp. NPDC059477 TaxID=3346847 RepID=UPI003679570D